MRNLYKQIGKIKVCREEEVERKCKKKRLKFKWRGNKKKIVGSGKGRRGSGRKLSGSGRISRLNAGENLEEVEFEEEMEEDREVEGQEEAEVKVK